MHDQFQEDVLGMQSTWVVIGCCCCTRLGLQGRATGGEVVLFVASKATQAKQAKLSAAFV